MIDSATQSGRDRPVATPDGVPSEELIQVLSSPRVGALVADLLREYEDGSALPHHFAKRILHAVGLAVIEDCNKTD